MPDPSPHAASASFAPHLFALTVAFVLAEVGMVADALARREPAPVGVVFLLGAAYVLVVVAAMLYRERTHVLSWRDRDRETSATLSCAARRPRVSSPVDLARKAAGL